MPNKSSINLIGTAGEYYVCAELCRKGFLALVTPKNNPLFDVVATNALGSKSVSIQVKTRSIHNKQGWKMGTPAAISPGVPFVVLVKMYGEDKLPDFYIYKYCDFVTRVNENFGAYISKSTKTGGARKDPGFRWLDEKNFTEADRMRLNDWELITDTLKQE